VPELIWEGKYDAAGRRVTSPRIALPFQTVETVNESAQERQRSLAFFAAERPADWRNRLIWGGRRRSVRLRLGVAGPRRLGPRRRRDAQPGQPALGRQDAAARRRRLGARLLPALPEPPTGLHRRVVERRRLGHGQRALRRRLLTARRGRALPRVPHWTPTPRVSRAASTSGASRS